MNGRIEREDTPEGRLAAVARTLTLLFADRLRPPPDYADFKAALAPYVERELLLVRIDEARTLGTTQLNARMRELDIALIECEKKIAKEFRP